MQLSARRGGLCIAIAKTIIMTVESFNRSDRGRAGISQVFPRYTQEIRQGQSGAAAKVFIGDYRCESIFGGF